MPRPERGPAAATLLLDPAALLLGRVAALFLGRAAARPPAATPLGELVIGGADFLESREPLLAEGGPDDLQGRLGLLGLHLVEEDAVPLVVAREVRPPDGELRLEPD